MANDDDVLAIKCVLLVVMLILSGVFISLPIVVTQIRRVTQIRCVKESDVARRKFILSLFNCFAGGIFVATGK